MPRAKTSASPVIELPPFDLRRMELRLIGDAPLICHAWSSKAKAEMLAKQIKRAQEARPAKDPEQDYQDSLYRHPDGGWAFPAIAFKAAAVDACSHVSGITKVAARGAFHIIGQWVRIEGEPAMREDMVRIGMGSTADLRYRGEFDPWAATVPLQYNASLMSAEQIVHLFNIAGFGVGVGEWRPQRDGIYGRFRVESVGKARGRS
jgi:hypothetical protein